MQRLLTLIILTGWALCMTAAKLQDGTHRIRYKDGPAFIYRVCLTDKDFPITIRNARKSDSIELRFGTKKLNRFFIDRKISMKEELSWPVMADAQNRVIFVSGIGCDVNHYCDDPGVFMIKC